MVNTGNDLTPKARRTREHILETALELFVKKGYEATTMRDIADQAACSLGLAYRYFSQKEEFVLALYIEMSEGTIDASTSLPPGRMGDRFQRIMEARLADAVPYREALGALFGAAVNPGSGVNVLGPQTAILRQSVRDAFVRLVEGADDALASSLVNPLGTLLYAGHFALILFWLYDRSEGQRVTNELLVLSRDFLNVLRPILALPFAGQHLARLADIMENVFLAPET